MVRIGDEVVVKVRPRQLTCDDFRSILDVAKDENTGALTPVFSEPNRKVLASRWYPRILPPSARPLKRLPSSVNSTLSFGTPRRPAD